MKLKRSVLITTNNIRNEQLEHFEDRQVGTIVDLSLEEYLKDLRLLVEVDCGTLNKGGIETIVSRFEEHFSKIGGWNSRRIHCGVAGPGLETRNKPEDELIDVLLLGHTDTVYPAGTVAERPMTTDARRAYGPGVSDMKSGLLNIVYALRYLEKDLLDKLSVCVCMNPDEEIGSLHSEKWLSNTAKKARVVLVAEAARADGSLIKARKGMARYKASFHGKSAHAGNEPQNGRSAITEMANWILVANAVTNFENGDTLNVGTVYGGTGANIVPERATATVDVRFWKNDKCAEIDAKLRRLAKQPLTKGVAISLVREVHKPSMSPTPEAETLMTLVGEVGQELGIDVQWQSVGGISDANLTAALGIPTLDGLGPIGACFHSPEEYLELDSIEPRIKLLMNVLTKLAGQTGRT